MNGNNYRDSHHHRASNQYLVAEQQQQQQQFGGSNTNNNGAKHLQSDPSLIASSRNIGAIYNGLPMQNHHSYIQQQQHPRQNQQHSALGFHQANGTSSSNSRSMIGPAASDYSMPPMPVSLSSSTATCNSNSASVNQLTDQLSHTHLDHQHQHQYYHQATHSVNGGGKSLNPNDDYQHYAPQRKNQHREQVADAESSNMDYANQLRQSQYRQKYQQQHHIDYNPNQQQEHYQTSSGSSNHNNNNDQHHFQGNGKHNDNYHKEHTPSYDNNFSQKVRNLNANEQQQQQQSTAKSTMHVNFNRSSRQGNMIGQSGEPGDDEVESSGRKKKYLTAKYGQQQMNLIKKRLKVEMWLFEQLKQLAKGTKSEDDLDEIDIDLDQILDMEDDVARRIWLKKLLQPYDDLPTDRVDKFINDVIEQSRLL